MPSSESSPAGALLSISLNMAGDTADVSVPPSIALAELMSAIIKVLRPSDPGAAARGFTIRTSNGRILSRSESLPDQRVRPGAVLTVEPSGTNVKDQRYDDLVEAMGTAVVESSVPWEETSSIQLSTHASAALVLLAALLLVTGSRESILTATVGACGVILAILATAVVARMPSRPGALSLGHITPILISCAAFAVTPRHWFSLPLAAAGIGLLAGLAILLVFPSDLRVSVTALMTTGVPFILVGGLVGMMDTPPDRAAATTLALLVVVMLSAPWVTMAQLLMTIGTNRGSERIDPVQVYSRVGGAHMLVISLRVGCSATMIVLAPLMATSPTATTMLAYVGLALMLATRSPRSSIEVVIGMLTDVSLTVVTAMATTTVIPDALPWTLDAIILVAVLFLAANVVSQKLRPWLVRLVDIARVLVLLGILPLAALVWGVVWCRPTRRSPRPSATTAAA